MKYEKNEINLILDELQVCIDPEILLSEYQKQIKRGLNYNKKNTEKYFKLIMSVNWFLKKIAKYQIYFNKFYSQSAKIPKHEALEHHIHAYLEDMITLRNKLTNYIDYLKKILKK